MANGTDDGDGDIPALNALVEQLTKNVYDVQNLSRLEKVAANAIQNALANVIGTILSVAGTAGAFEAGIEHARTALAAMVDNDNLAVTAASPTLALGLGLDNMGDGDGALAVFRQVGGNDTIAVREMRDQVAEHVRRSGKAVEQQNRGVPQLTGLAVKHAMAVCIGASIVNHVSYSPCDVRESMLSIE